MRLAFDQAKRNRTLEERGLDFLDAGEVFAGKTYTIEDDRFPYPERRFITFGTLDGRMVVLVWAAIDGGRRIISMRKANEREQDRYEARLGGPG